ncbi:MAG: glycoside hydrolase domain-containing protein [Candidatus Acidiferrales bacterium]
MKKILVAAILAVSIASGNLETSSRAASPARAKRYARYYLGFDRNIYPGDAELARLSHTFRFGGYWLNVPQGLKENTWAGKRKMFIGDGLGFLVLFSGRPSQELKVSANAAALGTSDGGEAVQRAKRESFPKATIIFLDVEEGGRMLRYQQDYILAWVDAVNAGNYRAGIYCSGIPVAEEGGVITAEDIRAHGGARKIVFWVYNDSCPPSPGCAFPKFPPAPSASGVAFADVWQFAQSPRRSGLTERCATSYSADGKCYPPGSTAGSGVFVDLDSASSADPSRGKT